MCALLRRQESSRPEFSYAGFSKVAVFSYAIALNHFSGPFKRAKAEKAFLAGLGHDVGKHYLPEHSQRVVEGTASPLGKAEIEEIKRQHTVLGSRHLERRFQTSLGSVSRLGRIIADAAHYHHEFIDGSGYEGLSGDEIPVYAKIVSVADQFAAKIEERPYDHESSVSTAIVELLKDDRLDQRLVKALEHAVKERKFMRFAHAHSRESEK